MKNEVFVLLLLFMSFSAGATVYGSYPVEQEVKTESLDTEVELAVVYTGDKDVALDFSFQNSSLYNVSDRVEVVEPSTITKSPEGSGWKYLGEGRYAEIKKFEFEVRISEYRPDNTVRVPVSVEATSVSGGKSGTESPISGVTSHGFNIFLDPQLRPLDRETGTENSVDWKREVEEKKDQSSEQNESSSETYKQKQNPNLSGEEKKQGFDTVTLVLAAGVVLMTLYVTLVV